MITLSGLSQSRGTIKIKKSNISLIGVWGLTDYNRSDKLGIWEFKSDSTFNELKLKGNKKAEFGDGTLAPDGNGTWSYFNSTLIITVTGEDTNGEQKRYSKPQLMKFLASAEGSDIILTIIAEDSSNDGQETIRLRKQ